MSDTGYLLDNRAEQAGERFQALSALFDANTFRHLREVGLTLGWRCWEVGAGGASVPRWLAQQVGPEGRVLATDIDPSWAEGTAGSTVEVRRHDVGRDAPPDDGFDLVHARLVLVHVPERDAALRAMAGALRPGGWLVVEEADPSLQPLACLEALGPEHALANKLRDGFRALMAQRGVDLAYGRKLPRLLREAGLLDVAAEAFFPVARPALAVLEAATVRLLRDNLVAAGLATAEEVARYLKNVASGRLDLPTSPMVSAWGRRAG